MTQTVFVVVGTTGPGPFPDALCAGVFATREAAEQELSRHDYTFTLLHPTRHFPANDFTIIETEIS